MVGGLSDASLKCSPGDFVDWAQAAAGDALGSMIMMGASDNEAMVEIVDDLTTVHDAAI